MPIANWDAVAAVVFSAVFVILGLLYVLKPELIIRFHVWQQRVFMGAKFIPSKKTEAVIRIMGVFLLAVGLVILYLWRA